MADITVNATGVVLSQPCRILAVVVRNNTGSAGSCELINDVTNNPANHKFTIPCPVSDIRGFNVPEGQMRCMNGLYAVLISVSEVLIVYD